MLRRDRRYGLSEQVGARKLAALAAVALMGSAAIVSLQAARSERANPPKGKFITIDGVRIHYVERGFGRPVVFLHGNGMMVEDMLVSGVLDAAAARSFRAIAIDRPGFGYSERPRGTAWTAAAHADLMSKVFAHLGLERPVVVGHSLGSMVALALALNHPGRVGGLVLASGYFYPTARADMLLVAPPATPVLGDLLCYTVAPLIGEALAPRFINKMFSPHEVPPRFREHFPVGMMLRPSQVNAASKDATHMIPDAYGLSARYTNLVCPVCIIGGDADAVVDQAAHALRLHRELPGSTLDIFAPGGHMIHYADPSRVVRAIERISATA